MQRTAVLLLAALAAGCGADRDTFAPAGPGGPEAAFECEREDFSYLVQDIVDVSEIAHYTCEAPAALDDGPQFDGWFAPRDVVPGGVLSVTVFAEDPQQLVGRTVILDAPEVLGHSRFVITDEQIEPRGARFQVLMRHDLAPGPQTLKVALLDDYGATEATGPAVDVPVQVVALAGDPGPRGLRIAMAFWSEGDPTAAPDIALQVVEPDGNLVDETTPASANGGALEVTGNADCVPGANIESISWPQDAAPGRYSASAVFADRCGLEADLQWTVSFSYFDRLLGVWEGESGSHGDPFEAGTLDLSFIDME
jgi:hypothetical protein